MAFKTLRLVFAALCLLLPRSMAAQHNSCTRIVSLAPSITETLFDLGLGDRLVGVTRFCRYPKEAQSIAQVGGFYDVSIERLVSLHPTEVFLLSESSDRLETLKRVGVQGIILDHTAIRGIHESYSIVGQRCGITARAEERLREFDRAEAEIRARCSKSAATAPKKALVVVGRTREGSVDTGVYVSGSDGFYSDILTLVGVVNVRSQGTVAVPTLSGEGILNVKPDVILEVVNVDDGKTPPHYMDFWMKFPSVPAVKNNRVFLLAEDYASIPGPRYIELARKLSALLCG